MFSVLIILIQKYISTTMTNISHSLFSIILTRDFSELFKLFFIYKLKSTYKGSDDEDEEIYFA